MSRAKYNQAVAAGQHERRLRLDAEERLAAKEAAESRADQATASTINRLATEVTALRGIVACLVVAMESDGRAADAHALRQQLAAAGVDVREEIVERLPTPDMRPAKRVFTPSESRLIGQLHLARKACGAFEDRCRDLQRINEAQALQLRQLTEGTVA
ncbi:hypothetical protein DN402_31485 [Streptomyces sp. SW4]|nr:hypothetical protein DN402_31485 [Streptomyces sp. SW4]